eukprot:m.53263 g.53263  ORF g.53263 m.53263 type:complete len:92 (+) comp12366_c0_seq2:131-406(+)
MTETEFEVVRVHNRRDLWDACADLLNDTWHRSKTARLATLEKCCAELPDGVALLTHSSGDDTPRCVDDAAMLSPTVRLGRHPRLEWSSRLA